MHRKSSRTHISRARKLLAKPFLEPHAVLDSELRLRSAAAGVSRISMPTELNHFAAWQREHLLELLPDSLQPLARLFLVCTRVRVLAFWLLAGRPCPQSDTPEGLANVDDDAHDLVIVLVLQHLADGCENDVEPGVIVRLATLESVGPAAAVLVLQILPFRANAFFEEMVVGLLGEFGGGGDVVLAPR